MSVYRSSSWGAVTGSKEASHLVPPLSANSAKGLLIALLLASTHRASCTSTYYYLLEICCPLSVSIFTLLDSRDIEITYAGS